MSELKKVAVIGASGYTGEELLRVLLRHPNTSIEAITSRQMAGKTLESVLGAVAKESPLVFENLSPTEVSGRADVFFLALPHGVASEFALPLLKAGKTVVDLSADFRLKDKGLYHQYYKEEHPAPDLLVESVYGLPELYRSELKTARLIACPGCYPTSTILGLAPALKKGLLKPDSIIVNSLSGISGAGKKADTLYSFCERDQNLMAYSVPSHRHIPEIEQELSGLAGEKVTISFTPHLVPLVRGMLTTTVAELRGEMDQAGWQKLYEDFYAGEAFVTVLGTDQLPETKRVIRTNHIEVAVRHDARTGRVLFFSAQDNLGKGAATQAVQAFNVRFGLDERSGLLG
ncbi:MAG: N-acetyl-gamma-glutamyl-phosphate reductase [Blastochloris sp.]|nr:N-acetyl-gamma-glutamyl-phosphate reductase [Blastochloris sp.]